MTIYISTGGFNTSKAEDISSNFLNIGIDTIELSGTSYHPNIIENLSNLKDKINFQIHNYFPKLSVMRYYLLTLIIRLSGHPVYKQGKIRCPYQLLSYLLTI